MKLLAITVFLLIFRLVIDSFPLFESMGGRSFDKIVTFFIAIISASFLGFLVKSVMNPGASELKMGVAFGVAGFVYLYLYYPARYFEQGVVLTLIQVVSDAVSLINVVQLILGPVLFALCLRWFRKRLWRGE